MQYSTFKFIQSLLQRTDELTREHSLRVASLSYQFSVYMGETNIQADLLYLCGLLHDVGKIGIDKEILSSKEKLNAEEFKQIKRHPELGVELIKEMEELTCVVPYVLHHHEHYDGSGYPHALVATAIPLESRILAICDAFDAMTSIRYYKQNMSTKQACQEISSCSSKQFDPELAVNFLDFANKKLKLFGLFCGTKVILTLQILY